MRIRFILNIVLILSVALPAAAGSERLEALSEEFFGLHGSDPGILAQAAGEAYMEGDYSTAAEYYLMALMSDLDDNPVALYNLACCYGLLGEDELAGNTLVLAAEAGFDRVELVWDDPDFANVADSDYFAACVDEMDGIVRERKRLSSESVLGGRLFLEFPSMQTARVHLPVDFDPQIPYDLVLALHGYSGDVSEFSSRWDAFERQDFIFVSLQAPYAFERNGRTVYSWAAFGSSPWDGQDMPEDQMEETYVASMDLSSDMVLACVEELRELYPVDRVFLLAFSQGGIVTYRTAMAHPDVFDGIATFSGVLDQDTATDTALRTASGLPVFLGRGAQEDDRAILARDRLVEAGFNVTFHEYQGGHYFPDSSLRAFEDWRSGLD